MKARSFIASAFLLSTAVLALLGPGEARPGGPTNAASPSVNPADPLFSTADAQNVEFVGHIGGATRAVAIQGNYAYVGEGPRLTILDISNPASPTVVGNTSLLPDIVWGVCVAGGCAYVADGSCALGQRHDPGHTRP
jgi:hypothetical protein